MHPRPVTGCRSPALAATGAKRTATPKNTVAYYTTIDRTLRPVTLTDDQKSKLDALKKDYEQKFKDAYAKEDSMLSPEQKKAGDDARKAATADGKTRREINQAVTDALKLTDQQKTQKKDAATAPAGTTTGIPRQGAWPFDRRAEAADYDGRSEEGRQAL